MFLGRTEFKLLASPFDTRRMATSNRAALMFTNNDFWAPVSVMEQAKADGVQCELLESIPHAMGVKASSAQKVAKWLCGKLISTK